MFVLSTLGSIPEDFDFEFDPVAEPTDKERADLAKCGTDNVVAAFNAGLISQRTALQELKQQSERTGVWTNITDEDIEKASAEVEQPGEMGAMPGMPPMGGDENGPDASTAPAGGGENVEQARAPVRQVKSSDMAFWGEVTDYNPHHSPENGRFCQADGTGGGGGKKNLQTQPNNANISATAEQKASFRKALIGCKTSCGAVIIGVSSHACDLMAQRGLSPADVKVALKLANPVKSKKYPDTYEYAINGRMVAISRDGNIKTVYWNRQVKWR